MYFKNSEFIEKKRLLKISLDVLKTSLDVLKKTPDLLKKNSSRYIKKIAPDCFVNLIFFRQTKKLFCVMARGLL